MGQSLLTSDTDQTITIWMRKMSVRTMAKKLKSTVCGNSWNDSPQHLPCLLHTAAFLTALNLQAQTQELTEWGLTQTRKGLCWHFQAVHPQCTGHTFRRKTCLAQSTASKCSANIHTSTKAIYNYLRLARETSPLVKSQNIFCARLVSAL